MTINIDQLTEAELVDLNHRVVARLKFLREMRSHQQMLSFNVGDRVAFQPPGYDTMIGVIAKYNRKTVTVITEQGQQWNVAPVFLTKVVSPEPESTASNATVIKLPRKK